MFHARPDYDCIQDPRGLIPEDEPVFLIRAQDLAAPVAVEAWADIAETLGASPDILKAAREQSLAMRVWQESKRVKIPDL